MKLLFGNELDMAVRVVADAAHIIRQELHSRRARWKVNRSGKREMVTDVDVEVNAYLNREISAKYPGDAVVGEELSYEGRKGNENRFWLVDPIDGTRSFVNLASGYSIMVSFVSSGSPCFAVVHDIENGETIVAHKDIGVQKVVGSRLEKLSKPHAVDNCLLWNPFVTSELKPFLMSGFGLLTTHEVESTGLRAIAMAKGKGKVFVSFPHSSKIWDTAPAFIIVHAVGGEYTDFEGRQLKFNPKSPVNTDGVVASIDIDHQEVLDALASYKGRL
jgi:3'(2'), 5'-bisphosphate nucleotidase